jgi:hypothetical protein
LLWDRWDDRSGRENILRVARAIEREQMLLSVSAHLLITARTPTG